uniref:Uncharacterized protein n=1 Tax=Oryza glumipatula TaxID=40148 RepID=A0A0D9ZWF1_9ORYZ
MDWGTAALNTILGRWGKKASPEWNISGELCSGFAADKTDWDYYPNINPFIKCDCTFSNNTLCHITRLGQWRMEKWIFCGGGAPREWVAAPPVRGGREQQRRQRMGKRRLPHG